MPKSYEKYLRKLPKQLKLKIDTAIDLIEILELKNLDIKKMKGFENIFRCRIGHFRIVFEKQKDKGVVLEINSRGDIYKKY